ncbi:hypothetical protein ACWDT5_09860 [Rhodococcus aetherivorans]
MAIDCTVDFGDDPFMRHRRVLESIVRMRHEAAVAAAQEAQTQAERER